MNFATELLHGTKPDLTTGAITVPIYQTAAYYQETAEQMESIFKGRKAGFVYTRVGNPTIANFERRIANLEHGLGAVAFASGMSAISMAILNVLESGDEIVSSSGLFGGTSALFKDLESFGIKVRYSLEGTTEDFSKLLNNRTKLLYVETIGNPKLNVIDMKELSELAHSNGLPLFVDSTVTTPYLVRPLDLGADVVIHSTSKMINGGGNSIGGVIVCGNKFKWQADKFPKLAEFEKLDAMGYLLRLRSHMLMNFGGCAAPLNVFLTGVGLDTLELRMKRACDNALALAEFLHNKGVQVNYLGLPNNLYHSLSKAQFNGHFGTMLTLRLGSKETAFKFINSLKFALNVSNIGDARTLVVHPASTIFLHAIEQEKTQSGVTDDLVRVSVGLEDIADLLNDFDQALQAIKNH